MNIQNILSSFSLDANQQVPNVANKSSSSLDSLGSMIPGGLVGGAAAGSIMALLMGSKSTKKISKKVVQYGGTAILAGLAFKAFDNWKANKALGQTEAIDHHDIQLADEAYAQELIMEAENDIHPSLDMVIINTMIAASKADGQIDAVEHNRLFDVIDKLDFSAEDKVIVFDAMGRDITAQEIADSVTLDQHKAEVYISAYLAIEVDDQQERAFLNNLAIALNLPKGFPAYLEQQADQGIAA
ncbi:MAG: uncharacterized membrane protein YebE (DUF533 family) [Cocleimonas sp.]|jgi:uncharacterized membrane protein YebE (DUF533 family)